VWEYDTLVLFVFCIAIVMAVRLIFIGSGGSDKVKKIFVAKCQQNYDASLRISSRIKL